jgi:chemotaxis regulatin CheY-phosphate phosphatase CheZ
MSGYLATRDASESEYEAIQLAVMETERGRWFLSEYARRNRHAETEVLLDSLMRIEQSVTQHREPAELDRFRLNVLEMARAIARTRAEIAAIKPPETDGRIMEASGELDSIVSATESATSEILAAAEQVQEVAWTLREAGSDTAACDMLDQHAVGIYTACSFQDLTAQRTRKVIEILSFLETRVNAMADIWQFAQEDMAPGQETNPATAAAADPAMSQADVDVVLVDREIEVADFEIEMANQGIQASADRGGGDQALDFQEPATAVQAAGHDTEAQGGGTAAPGDAPAAPGDAPAAPGDDSAAMPAWIEARKQEAAGSLGDDAEDGFDLSALAEEALSGQIEASQISASQIDPAQIDPARIDDILFTEHVPAAPPVIEGRPQLQLVVPAAAENAIFGKARDGQTLTPDEAATAMDALKNMSVEERTRLFS